MTDVGTTPRKAMNRTRRLRIWEAAKGVCCICDEKIDGVREKWIIEHKRALVLGGTDTDENLGPAHESCRRVKDKVDVADGARAKRRKAKHLGIKTKSRGFYRPPGVQWDWKLGRNVKEAT